MIWISSKKNKKKKIRPIKNTRYHWLINHIPEPIRKRVGGFKEKFINNFKTNLSEQTVYGIGRKLSNLKTQKQSEENDNEYYKPKRLSNFWHNNHIEYESHGDRNKNL